MISHMARPCGIMRRLCQVRAHRAFVSGRIFIFVFIFISTPFISVHPS